ncbi:MAG TPA: hypothetical protein PJ982_01765, partial [Lacipirellulaceae bacterium]|nr:hypothetical protein [Lacipirellulaceae bacterium]
GYKGRDLSPEAFEQRLKVAIERRRAAVSRAAPQSPYSPYHEVTAARAPEAASDFAQITSSMQGILRHDENNTSMEHQVSEIAKNHAQHNLALSLMTAQFRLLRAAITERA